MSLQADEVGWYNHPHAIIRFRVSISRKGDIMIPKDFSSIPQPSAGLLTERQLIDYRVHCEEFIRWLRYAGEDPEQLEGAARGTIERTASRTGALMRWV